MGRLVDRLKKMDPKNSLPTLEKAADDFNNVLDARRFGIPLDHERPVEEQEDEDDTDIVAAAQAGSGVADVMAQQVDKNHDGIVSVYEFERFEETLRKVRKWPSGTSMKELHKMMDKN